MEHHSAVVGAVIIVKMPLFALLAIVCAAAVQAESVSDAERTLGPSDFSYYRFSGKGETFVMTTAWLTTNVVERQRFWRRVESDKVPVIYQLVFPRKKGWKWHLPETAAEAVAAIDAFFAPCEGVAPCPEKIFAVTPAEENVTWAGQLAVQDSIAKHIRDKYGVKTYQWLTEPLRPTLDIQADGWVLDAYSVTDPGLFHSHLESFILTGLPVVPCLWASGNFDGYHKAKSWDDLTRFTVERMDMCRALGLPVLVFAVHGPQGSVHAWFSPANNPGEQYYRETIRNYLAAVPTLPEASWRPPEKVWTTRATENGKIRARVDLKSFYLTDTTTFDNVRNWRLEKGGLALLGERGALSWTLQSVGKVEKGMFTLRHSKDAKGFFCGIPLSADGVTVVPDGSFHTRHVALEANSPIRLDELVFEGEGEFVVQDVELCMDTSYGRTDYRAVVTFGGDAALGGAKGAAVHRRIVRRIPLPGHVRGRLILSSDVLADTRNYGGKVVMLVLSEDGKVLAKVASDPSVDGRQKLRITDDPPDAPFWKQGLELPYGTKSIDIAFDLSVGCGLSTPRRFGAQVFAADVKFRPLLP